MHCIEISFDPIKITFNLGAGVLHFVSTDLVSASHLFSDVLHAVLMVSRCATGGSRIVNCRFFEISSSTRDEFKSILDVIGQSVQTSWMAFRQIGNSAIFAYMLHVAWNMFILLNSFKLQTQRENVPMWLLLFIN